MNKQDRELKVAELIVHTSAIAMSILVLIATITIHYITNIPNHSATTAFYTFISIVLFFFSMLYGIGYILFPKKRYRYNAMIFTWGSAWILLLIFVVQEGLFGYFAQLA